MAQDELAKLPPSSSNPNVKEIENHIFSQYLKMIDAVGLLVATEELRLEMIAKQGGSESIEVVTACSIDTYSQWSNLLPAAIQGSAETFGTVYCQLGCHPPGTDHATYSESSLSCQEEAASLYSLYHECDRDIQKAQGFGFDGNPGNGTQPIVEGSVKYGSSSLSPIISERAAVCSEARRFLMTASFDETLVPTMPSSERSPESFSTYEPDYGGHSGGFSVPVSTPPPSHCMTSRPEDRMNRVAKLREYYAEVRESLIYEKFGAYSSPDFEAITATTNGFFEEFFQDADPGASINPCANGAGGVGTHFKTFLNTYVGPALDSISLTGQIGTGNAQQEAAKAHLDRVLEQITVVGTRIEDQTPENIAALNAELDLVKLQLHDAYNPYGVWGGAVGDAVDPTLIAGPTGFALKRVLTNKKLAVSTIRAWHGFAKFLSKPLLLGRETGAIGKKFIFARSQLQHEFKHAGNFGISGNPNNLTLKAYEIEIRKHLNDPRTNEIVGTYYGTIKGFHYFNPDTKLWAFFKENGDYHSSWKLGEKQIKYLLEEKNVR